MRGIKTGIPIWTSDSHIVMLLLPSTKGICERSLLPVLEKQRRAHKLKRLKIMCYWQQEFHIWGTLNYHLKQAANGV
jgi:hypothetical protein